MGISIIIVVQNYFLLKKGREIFFCGKDNSNAVEISLNNEHVEIEIKIKDKKKVED